MHHFENHFVYWERIETYF